MGVMPMEYFHPLTSDSLGAASAVLQQCCLEGCEDSIGVCVAYGRLPKHLQASKV